MGRKHGLDIGGGLLIERDAPHLSMGALLSSVSFQHLSFKASCNFLKSPATGLGDFEEGEDQEDHEEAGENNKNVGSQIVLQKNTEKVLIYKTPVGH